MLLFVGMRASAQITTSSCTNTYAYCDADTVKLEPQDIVTYTNFQWFAMGAPDVAINAGNAATYDVDPTRLTVPGTIYVTNDGGTYILKAEYATPSGCATKNDTITINFLTLPDLVTTTDTICASASQSANLASLVVDNNAVAGTTPTWYPTLADAKAGTNALASTTVSPSATTKYYVRKNTTAVDAEGTACYDIDSVIIDVRCLNLGNFIAFDTNNNGSIDAGENGIAGVDVQLFFDANGNGSIDPLEQTPYATATTNTNGYYLFTNLPPGDYFVGIPASEFASGGTLQHLYSSGTTINNAGVTSETGAPDPDAVASTTDDNGQTIKTGFYTGGVMTNGSVTLSYTDEPTGEPDPGNASTVADADDNLTVGFTFYGMSLGTTVFADVNNNGVQDPGEGGIAGVTVHLYAANGTTILATTTSDADGNVVFPGLAEGDYIIGVDYGSPALAGQHSSDDIATSGTPESTDGDDNGVTPVGTIVQSNVITLDAGTEPGGTGLAGGNPLTPTSNTNYFVDFGSVPDCPTITNPTGAQTICATEGGTNLTATASSTAGNIRFVRHASAQTGNAMYSGGTVIANSVAPVAGIATYTFNTADFPNTGTTVLTYYVYAIMATPSADPTCRPYQEIQVVVNPKPTAANASITECENALGSGEGDFTLTDANTTVLGGQTGMTVTYHATLAHAQAGTPDLTSAYAASAGTIYVRVENTQGCYATATITLNVSPKPDFTLALATVCPGENPEVTISGLLNSDPMQSTVAVNGSGSTAYSDFAADNITTLNGLSLGATNTITVTNTVTGCSTDKTIAVPNITPLVCPPVNVSVKRAGE